MHRLTSCVRSYPVRDFQTKEAPLRDADVDNGRKVRSFLSQISEDGCAAEVFMLGDGFAEDG